MSKIQIGQFRRRHVTSGWAGGYEDGMSLATKLVAREFIKRGYELEFHRYHAKEDDRPFCFVWLILPEGQKP